jgi:hypothetical protein
MADRDQNSSFLVARRRAGGYRRIVMSLEALAAMKKAVDGMAAAGLRMLSCGAWFALIRGRFLVCERESSSGLRVG